MLGSVRGGTSYLDVAFPAASRTTGPTSCANEAKLGEPGRMKALQQMGRSAPVDAGEQLGNVRCPALIIQGSLDPDWADPRAEGEAIVAAMPAGLAKLEVIEGAGHYPHTQFPDETVALGSCPSSRRTHRA